MRPTVAEMVFVICQLNRDGDFSAAQFRDRLDNGRKVAVQILEFFDRHGVTLRRGDLRRLNKHRVELFGPQGRESSPVERPDFKSGRGREPVLDAFDSLSLPPRSWKDVNGVLAFALRRLGACRRTRRAGES
jgi:selenocysteine-specific elongation factor